MSPRRKNLSRNLLAIRTPPAWPGARIGLFGGTFNPPHAGHVAISETALKRLRLDRLWWLVTPGNPLKERAALPLLKERMSACRRLVRDPRIAITGFEADLGEPYSATTVDLLRRRFPRTRFVWVMGADNLAGFHRWRDWRRIAALVPIAVIDRPGFSPGALASPAARALAGARLSDRSAARLANRRPPAWIYLRTRLSTLSSTGLRSGK